MYRVVFELQEAGILECPKGLEIIVYPSSVEERCVALITVCSAANFAAHVVAGTGEIRKLAIGEVWEGDDIAALTADVVEGVIGCANGAIAAVRELERWGAP